ncbi:hypothetical protein WMY93_030020 [Mugilogobius chulae]|uniref:Ig-like domain-containing protein n=1 Tax=Mugilogobius chulae TaxID=88201 RepID=A0AAW0MQY2_9GOBI
MLSCHSLSTRPPKLTWNLHQDTANITESNSDGTFTTKITQNITLTDAHDGLMIKCNASYPMVLKHLSCGQSVRFTVSRSVSDTELLQQSQASCPTLHLVQTQLAGASQSH